ncbi:uncharacterized protein PAE49_022995 isoform 2-T2 [Odontesthes bonariensis]|uniref:uncharacterized protein LOC142371418 isoform X2 n=1 Tax=Odontesthes bonariensis TaxID=219752 RepID=UPI003F58CF98
MSVDGTALLFEGFLQKRKDTLKILWVTYWFRLQNTALFFYTQKNGSATHLRGYYYICSVQSVREVQKAGGRHFMFEIIMRNGKRKMLAAETAALRKEWVVHLWQAMHLSTSRVSVSSGTILETCEEQDRLKSSTPICSRSEGAMKWLPAQPLSAPAPSNPVYSTSSGICFLDCPPEEQDSEEAIYQNLHLPSNDQNLDDHSVSDPQWSGGTSNAEESQNGDYDVLPCRKNLDPSTEMTEDIYDIPQSYQTSTEHQDGIYDVPSGLMRRASETGDEQPEGTYERI